MTLEVRVERLVNLLERQLLFVVAELFEGVERVADSSVAAGLDDAVVVDRAALVVLEPALYARLGHRRLDELRHVRDAAVDADVAAVYEHLGYVADLLHVGVPEVVERLVVGEPSEVEADLYSVHPVVSVEEGVFEDLGEVDRAVLASEVALAGDLDLLTAEDRVVARVAQRHAVADESADGVPVGRDRRVGHPLRPHEDDELPELVRRPLVDADRHSRMRLVHRSHDAENVIRDLVRRVLSGLGDNAGDRHVVDAVLPELHEDRGERVHILIPAPERVHILIEPADAVDPVPEAVEPHELSRLEERFGLFVGDLAARLFDREILFFLFALRLFGERRRLFGVEDDPA